MSYKKGFYLGSRQDGDSIHHIHPGLSWMLGDIPPILRLCTYVRRTERNGGMN